MCNDKVTPISKVKPKTDLEILHETLETMDMGSRVALTKAFENPPEALLKVLRDSIELSCQYDTPLNNTLLPGVMGYFNGFVASQADSILRFECLLQGQLEWFLVSLRNRFNLPDDDPLMVEITNTLKGGDKGQSRGV